MNRVIARSRDILENIQNSWINIQAGFRALLFIITAIISLFFMFISSKTPFALHFFIRLFWKTTAIILGMKVKCHGQVSPKRPLLIVGNHSSYLDIAAINSAITTTFVAKSEVAKWPILGKMAQFAGTLFINRDMTKVKVEKNSLKEMISEMAVPVTIFPEGTSNNGNEIKKFKSSLFAMIEEQMQNVMNNETDKTIEIQPLTIAYTTRNGKKINNNERDLYAWYIDPNNPAGDEDFAPHFWNVFKHGGRFTVEIILHDPLNLKDFKNRKEIAKYCQDTCQTGLDSLIK